jgi:hypothetical protein
MRSAIVAERDGDVLSVQRSELRLPSVTNQECRTGFGLGLLSNRSISFFTRFTQHEAGERLGMGIGIVRKLGETVSIHQCGADRPFGAR